MLIFRIRTTNMLCPVRMQKVIFIISHCQETRIKMLEIIKVKVAWLRIITTIKTMQAGSIG